jgi:hypothetical protein
MAPLRVTGRRLPRTLAAQETLDEATTVQFPGLGGVVPERFVAPALTCAQCRLAIRRRHRWRAYLALADRYCAKGPRRLWERPRLPTPANPQGEPALRWNPPRSRRTEIGTPTRSVHCSRIRSDLFLLQHFVA